MINNPLPLKIVVRFPWIDTDIEVFHPLMSPEMYAPDGARCVLLRQVTEYKKNHVLLTYTMRKIGTSGFGPPAKEVEDFLYKMGIRVSPFDRG
jgi:hypothetical protein